MKKYAFIIALIAAMILSSCSLCNPVVTDDSGKAPAVVTTTDDGSSLYTAEEIALVSEKGIVLYVDEACNVEICKEEVVKGIVESQILDGTTSNIKTVNISNEIWAVLKKTMSGSPIVSMDSLVIKDMIAKDPRVETYINIIWEKGFISLWAWALGEENVCNDGVDNNGDGKTDLDDENCASIAILYDSRCTDWELCDIKGLEEWLTQQTFNLGFAITTIDYTTDEWKALYNIVWGKLPTILADGMKEDMQKSLEEADLIKKIETDDYTYQITFLPSTWDPAGELCNNEIDDDGNGQIDCEDTSCATKKECRKETKGQLDVFLMGYCPFGEIAAKQIPLLKEALNNNFTLGVHFIANKTWEWDTASDFDSLHGVPEAEENIRQLCIQKYSGTDKLIDYMQVRYENADNYGKVTDAPSIALEAIGADVVAINTCVTDGEWGKMLAEDIKIAADLWIGASPTWLANNRYEFGGIDANAIKTEFCKYNSEIEECNNEEAIDTGAATAEWDGPSCE